MYVLSISGPRDEPIFDFALIETTKALWPFDTFLKPVCLPERSYWKHNFVSKFVKVTGYGRVEEQYIAGKYQIFSIKC